MRNILSCLMLLFMIVMNRGYAQNITNGVVLSAIDKKPLSGVNIKIKEQNQKTLTDVNGKFTIKTEKGSVLTFTSVGFEVLEKEITAQNNPLVILLNPVTNELNEVGIVSTGYQQLPKERATGSFVQVDNKLFNRRVGTDVLSRLEDVTSGLIFNRGENNKSNMSIRGQSTLFANVAPLIVLDNFPFEGDPATINPNDVESITVLKDAAAASIWGARAGNGVIVITTKKGSGSNTPEVSFNSNFTFQEKPNLYSQPRISTNDFIDAQQYIFSGGYYNDIEQSPSKFSLTPVIELLIAARDNPALKDVNLAKINALKAYDIRDDLSKYLYRTEVRQQYSLGINGSSKQQRYYLSAGYDENQLSAVGSSYKRITVNAKNTYSFIKDRLTVGTGLYYAQATGKSEGGINNLNSIYPYARLADAQGNPLEIDYQLTTNFKRESEKKGLLDWSFVPLRDLPLETKTVKQLELRLNLDLNYKILPGLDAGLLYQYGRTTIGNENLYDQNSYFSRNLINRYTSMNPDGSLKRPIPLGGIFDQENLLTNVQNVRTQLNYNKRLGKRHVITALAGWELRSARTIGDQHRLYGYEQEYESSKAVDLSSVFPQMPDNGYTVLIPDMSSRTSLSDHFLSSYFNGAYTLDDKYTVSASVRKDQSNLFGVRTNQKGVPLSSLGISWDMTKEEFFKTKVIDYLKLRATYGSSGNIDKTASAYTIASYRVNAPFTKLRYAQISNPPNPDLRWERVKTVNLGLDFKIHGNWLSGTLEYYNKNGVDLIGDMPYTPSTGILSLRGNTAETKVSGIDVTLNARLGQGRFKWNGDFLWSTVKDRVTKYQEDISAGIMVFSGSSGAYPLEGKTLYGIYSFKWAGLDPQTGKARGYLDGVPSVDYTSLMNVTKFDDIVFHGSARPLMFGALRNTFSYDAWSVSANISYRLKYYFKKESLYLSALYNGNTVHGDFANRWQKPGDEMNTNVPAVTLFPDYDSASFYNNSETLVYKGDHIRLQDVSVSYKFPRAALMGLSFKQVEIYLYANNLGILWTANKLGIDPDYQRIKPARSIAAGLRANF